MQDETEAVFIKLKRWRNRMGDGSFDAFLLLIVFIDLNRTQVNGNIFAVIKGNLKQCPQVSLFHQT